MRASRSPAGRRLITYYHENSPMGVTVKAVRARVGGPIEFAVVGLGTGTFACFAEPGDSFKFYEIDASVEKLARDPDCFHYLAQCAPDHPGRARRRAPDACREPDQYDLIVLDAFSSDAIPIHLMTREAMATYVKKLAPDGIVMMHISNRHLELGSVVAGIAHANGLVSRVNNRAARDDEDDAKYVFTSNVVISAREEKDFGAIARRQGLDRAQHRCEPAHLDRRLFQRRRRDRPQSAQGPRVHVGGVICRPNASNFPMRAARNSRRCSTCRRGNRSPTRCSRTALPAARTCSPQSASPRG